MSGNKNKPTESVKTLHSLLDEDYVGKEVVVIAFDKEKSAVNLDDNFILLEAIEKRERRIKMVALFIAGICFMAIILSSVKLLQADSADGQRVVVVTETPKVQKTPAVTMVSTEEPTQEPTVPPTKKPKKTKKPKRTRKPIVVTQKPVVITEEPVVVTQAPVVTTKPVVTQKPKEDDPFVEVDDPFVE